MDYLPVGLDGITIMTNEIKKVRLVIDTGDKYYHELDMSSLGKKEWKITFGGKDYKIPYENTENILEIDITEIMWALLRNK